MNAAPHLESLKALLGRAIFALSGFDQIHIIGCSRSGTTMLHLAMTCFADVVLAETETGVKHPHLGKRLDLALRHGWRGSRKHYVTKRNSAWHLPRQTAELVRRVRAEKIGLIHLVRDPRDVMLSRHAASRRAERGEPYVTGEHWYNSIEAADRIFAALADYPRKLTLRFEDLVLDPERSEQRIAECFGLRRNPEALPIDRIRDNFERLNIRVADDEMAALNGLRNMDASSIGRWRHVEGPSVLASLDPPIRMRCERFCDQYGY